METPDPLAAPTDAHVQDAVRRLVRTLDPLRVAVFGSVARGEARPGSDLDLLVVLAHADDRRALRLAARRALVDLDVAKDVVVTTPEEIGRRGGVVGTVLHEALREGRTVYERPGGGVAR
ncbi:nucleotidyltransferase domain-containing protein [Rubrivirga sp. S365]|uniref:Nucleotidyltransferase domain-containing protein n=1 Tax=Rubrivirga litoralis TaxID=3075598 RepID=A0ABU3BTT4_9BACT|nr:MULTISPECIES: nucleotidyltransferase domain-containing protein [unclassified Rubrivirga]MDT0632697.1 nucleotidyltransferase domain-containing protein [Rubrivirga sp. F394]MDT7857837.1 nucleotidyltransferase domain-containing protein [Rubrivirga sp. S365]